ncbi:MAG TPA: DUF748 domain-containing protein [Thermodesulfovibrionales bacterium]|nr:DUF748 domain-containing protein [Thermodesulfovibrionales bacterium]
MRPSPLLRKILIGVLVFLVLFSVSGFFVLPPVLKSVLVGKLSEGLHREVSIGQIKINPFVLSLDVKGLAIKDRKKSETFFSFDELYLNIEAASLVKRGLIISEIRLERPFLNIVLNEDLSYNFSDIIEEFTSTSKPSSKPLRFSLNDIHVRNGSLDFWDGPRQTKHTVRDMNIAIPFLSNLPYAVETYTQPKFEAKINNVPLLLQGMTKPFADSLETSFDLNIKGLDIPYYLAYVPFGMDFKILSGSVDTAAVLSYTQYKDRSPAITLAGSIGFKNIRLVEKNDSPLIGLPLVDISISSADLLSRKVRLSKVFLQSPEIDLVLDKAGRPNLESLIPEKGYVLKRGEESPALVVDADEVIMADGRLSFSDLSGKRSFKTTLENIEMKIDHFSNGRDKKSALSFSLRTEAGEGMKVTGDFSVDPLTSAGTAEFRQLVLKKYSPYYRDSILFEITRGDLDIMTMYEYAKAEPDPEIRFSRMAATLRSLMLKRRDEEREFLRIPVVTIADTAIDLKKREITVGQLSTDGGVLSLKRYPDGRVNVGDLLPSSPPATGKPQPGKKENPGKPWLLVLRNIAAENYAIKGEDLVPAQEVIINAERIRFRGEGISTAKGAKAKAALSFTVDKKGSVSANGAFSIDPLSMALAVDVKDVSIVPVQPYFTDKVKVIVTDGAVSSKGNFSFAYTEAKGIAVAYKGEASLSHFATVDKLNAEDFLKWTSLYLSGVDIGYRPLSVGINEVALSDFYSRLIINADGSLNVQGIIEDSGGSPESPGPAREEERPSSVQKDLSPKMVKIEKVTLQGGTINFSDRFVKRNYSATLLEIGGRISGLSSEESKLADVHLMGKLEGYAPLEITGRINPLREDLYVDLKVDFRDMDLSPITPYSGKYIGYTIQKGKLDLNLQYLIVKKKLDSQNRVFLDQLELGEKVESPDATKLPVRLAIALLKNRKGEIRLDIPVSGQTDDPKFSLGRIIIKILINLLVKAATSPFALLGAIFGGGGEELSYLDFDYGSSAINEQGEKKLSNLVKALYDRPALKLEIEGHVDTERDREGLRQYLFNKKIKAQKLKDMVKKEAPAFSVDEVRVEEKEYPLYLKMAYKEEKFPKPRNIIGIAKDLPVAEMEKLMLTHIEVKDDDLRHLASLRALNVKEYILKSKQIEQERIFLLEPKSLQPEKKENLRYSRVDFRLK